MISSKIFWHIELDNGFIPVSISAHNDITKPKGTKLGENDPEV